MIRADRDHPAHRFPVARGRPLPRRATRSGQEPDLVADYRSRTPALVAHVTVSDLHQPAIHDGAHSGYYRDAHQISRSGRDADRQHPDHCRHRSADLCAGARGLRLLSVTGFPVSLRPRLAESTASQLPNRTAKVLPCPCRSTLSAADECVVWERRSLWVRFPGMPHVPAERLNDLCRK